MKQWLALGVHICIILHYLYILYILLGNVVADTITYKVVYSKFIYLDYIYLFIPELELVGVSGWPTQHQSYNSSRPIPPHQNGIYYCYTAGESVGSILGYFKKDMM